jgi:hypothetical protein
MTMTCDRVRELASGFVLGALEIDEMIAVQEHLEGCDKPHPEIEELGGVLGYLAILPPPSEPPAWLRESVIAAARAESPALRRVGKTTEHRMAEHAPEAPEAPVAPAPVAPVPSPVIPLRGRIWARRRAIATWASRAAAALLVVSLAGYAYVLQNDLDRSRNEPGSVLNMMNPGSRQVFLSPSDASSAAAGVAVLQPTGHIFVAVNNLPETNGDQVYVVWASGANGEVSRVGSFTIDASGWAQVQYDDVPNSASLWLSIRLEANGQVDKPTGPIVLSGLLSA